MSLVNALAATPRPDGYTAPTRRVVVRAIDYEARTLEVQDGGATFNVPYEGFVDDYSIGDVVTLRWEPTGPIVQGIVGGARTFSADAAPGAGAAPTGLTLDRSGTTVAASCDAYAGASQYRWRTSLNGGSTWAPTVTTTSPSRNFGIGEGKTLTVQVAAYASGAWTLWSASVSVSYPLAESDYEIATVTLLPSDSGTYRVDAGAWDRWNTSRWGGARDVYQEDANAYGSGPLVGWAGWGDRIKNLGAVDITEAVLKARRNPWTNEPTPAVLQVRGSTAGTQPGGNPSSTGTGVTTSSPGARLLEWTSIALPSSVRDAMRTGSVKGLLAVGSDASGWYAEGGSFALALTYRRKV